MLAQIPIEIINRILETVDNVFEICMKIVVKIGSTNKVKPMLIENMDEKGLTERNTFVSQQRKHLRKFR